jgi:E3 ubiquitin-protein ligase TRIP12
VDFKGSSFAMLLQERCLLNNLVIMGFTGGSNLDGNKGDHVLLAPAYNIKKEEVEKIVDIFVQTVEEILREYSL